MYKFKIQDLLNIITPGTCLNLIVLHTYNRVIYKIEFYNNNYDESSNRCTHYLSRRQFIDLYTYLIDPCNCLEDGSLVQNFDIKNIFVDMRY